MPQKSFLQKTLNYKLDDRDEYMLSYPEAENEFKKNERIRF